MNKFRDRINQSTGVKESKKISAMTTGELKDLIGTFEDDYIAHCIGPRVRHLSLGLTFQGIVDWAISQRVLTSDGRVRYEIYHNWWRPKYEAMQELRCRRSFAEKKELEQLNKTAEIQGEPASI